PRHDQVGVRDGATVDPCHQADPRSMGLRRLGAGHRDAGSDRAAAGGIPQASEAVSWSTRLTELGLVLPPVPSPAGAYVPAARCGSLVFTAGQLPLVDGTVAATGKLGAEIDTARGRELARTCVLNALAAVDDLVGLDAAIQAV